MSSPNEPTGDPAPDPIPETNEIAPPRKSRIPLVVGLVLLSIVSVLVLREAGAIDFSLYSYKHHTKYESNFDTRSRNRHGVDIHSVNWVVHADDHTRSHIGSTLSQSLGSLPARHSVPYQGNLSVQLTSANMSGSYALPLIKHGTCHFSTAYKIHVSGHGMDLVVEGKLNGTVTFEVSGPCSVRKLQQKVGESIAQAVTNQLAGILQRGR